MHSSITVKLDLKYSFLSYYNGAGKSIFFESFRVCQMYYFVTVKMDLKRGYSTISGAGIFSCSIGLVCYLHY